MRLYICRQMQRIIGYLEIFIALAVTFVIAMCIINYILRLVSHPFAIKTADAFYGFLDDSLSLIIGIEFLKMLIIPTSDNVIETLLFAVSRHIILDHGTDVMILGVISVAVLFLTKKYLLSEFEEISDYHFKGSTPVNTINAKLQSDFVPDEPNETIAEFITKRLKEEKIPIEKGASITVGSFEIRLGKIENSGLIKKVLIHPLSHSNNLKDTEEVLEKQ